MTLKADASLPKGVPDNVVPTMTEDARTLEFESQGFEEEQEVAHRPTCPRCGSVLGAAGGTCPTCGAGTSTRTTSSAPGDPSLEGTPARLGDFQIVRVIGRGGMGTVYEAYQESMHRPVALKVLDVGMIPSRGAEARFEREAWIGGRLSHPNIVKVYAHGVHGRSHYITMELAGGRSLHEVIQEARVRRHSARSDSQWRAEHVRRVVSLFVGIADALSCIHEHGIVHRDIKPSNMILSEDGQRLLLTDFGLAKDLETAQMTRGGDLLGTIRYMSPEQLLAQRVKVDHRTDIWSLGISLYEAVALDLPYAADSDEAYISAVSMKEPVPARRRDRAVPKDLETVLMKCLERDPARRYSTASELRDDLTRLLEETPVLARRRGPLTRVLRAIARRWRLVAASAAAVLAASVALYFATANAQRGREMERVRWTLEEVIKTGEEPLDVQPDWETKLQPLLQAALRADPDSDLAHLALVAAARTKVTMPRFGLASDPIPIGASVPQGMDPGIDCLYVADTDWCWDGGVWEPLASVAWHPCRMVYGTTGWLERTGDESKFRLGPHHIELRTTIAFYEYDPVLVDSLETLGTGIVNLEGRSDCWTEVRRGPPLFTEVVSGPPLAFDVFEEYPPDFPYSVHGAAAADSALASFQIREVRLARLRLPEGVGRRVAVRIDGIGNTFEYNVRDATAEHPGYIIAFELVGACDPNGRLPLAASAALMLPGRAGPLMRFGLASGLGHQDLLTPDAYPSHCGTGSIAERVYGVYSLVGSYDVDLEDLNLITAPFDSVADGLHPARLELRPSREIALHTHVYDHYLGEELVLPVQLRVTTYQGTWENGN